MAIKDTERWMWSEACEMLMRAERLHRQMFQPQGATRQTPAWEPPADIFETGSHVVIYVALPGVDPDRVELAIHDGELIIAGVRTMPAELHERGRFIASNCRKGRFRRHIPLPSGIYDQIGKTIADGCLMISLRKHG